MMFGRNWPGVKAFREAGIASGGNKEEAALEYLLQDDEKLVPTAPAASEVIGQKEITGINQ